MSAAPKIVVGTPPGRVLVERNGGVVAVQAKGSAVIRVEAPQRAASVQVAIPGPPGPAGPAGASGADVRNAICPSGVAVDDLVYITGDEVGGALQVDTVDIDDPAKMPALGVVLTKPTATTCTVHLRGELTGLSGLTAGAPVFVGTNSQLTTTVPALPGSGIRHLQRMGGMISATKMLFDPSTLLIEMAPT